MHCTHFALLGVLVICAAISAEALTGFDAKKVAYRQGSKGGHFLLREGDVWHMNLKANLVGFYDTVGRDEGAVYLKEQVTGEQIELDIAGGTINKDGTEGWGQIIFERSKSAPKPNGYTMGLVKSHTGKYEEVSRDRWTRYINGAVYELDIVRRGQRAIKLKERGGRFSVVLNARRETVLYKPTGGRAKVFPMTTLDFTEAEYGPLYNN